jgi:hypothetical protein
VRAVREGPVPAVSPEFVDGYLLPVSHQLSSVCVCVCVCVSKFSTPFVCLFVFVVLELELRAFTLSHSTRRIFQDRVSWNYLPGLGVNLHRPDLCLLSS